MTYEELKAELSERSISQLPALLQHIAKLCGSKPVFKDREAMLRFVGRAWDSALVPEREPRDEGGVYEPVGIKFYSQSRHQEMMLVTEGPHIGWICYRHPDRQWVSLRKATEADFTALANAQSV